MNSYTIEVHPHGRLVMGPIPISDFAVLSKLVSDKGVIHSGVANYYGASLAMGEPDEMQMWEAEIEASLKDFQPPESRFIHGTHVGVSSKTIIAVLSKDRDVLNAVQHSQTQFRPDHPYDASDFGRCHYLLTLLPEWVERLGEVAAKYPETKWAALVPAWPELTMLHNAGKRTELGDRIRELIK